MQGAHRQTRKPRLFSCHRHRSAPVALLLALSPAIAAAPVDAGLKPEPASLSLASPFAGTQCESSHELPNSSAIAHQALRSQAPRAERAAIGWAVALLLVGIAVGRHSAKPHSEPA